MFTVMAHFHLLAFSRKVDYLKLKPISFGVVVPLASLRVNKLFCLLQNQHQKMMLKMCALFCSQAHQDLSKGQAQRSRVQKEKPDKQFQDAPFLSRPKCDIFGWYFSTIFSFKLFYFTGHMALVHYTIWLLLNVLGGSLFRTPARIKS